MPSLEQARHRLAHEVKAYLSAAAYLYVCLGAVLIYRWTLVGAHGAGALHFGTAAIKAAVLAKFLLLGEAARLGERMRPTSLLLAVLHRSLALLAVLVVLSLIEEAVVGLIHGDSAEHALEAFGAGRWQEIAASCLLLWLVLMPYVAFQRLRGLMDDDAWTRFLRNGNSG